MDLFMGTGNKCPHDSKCGSFDKGSKGFRHPAMTRVGGDYNTSTPNRRASFYEGRMIESTPPTCDVFGACCLNVGNPPFLLDMKEGTLRCVGGSDSRADFHRLLVEPTQARAAYVKNLNSTKGPCSWLDVATRRCRHYEFRP